ncbi:MAG: hypothetical protein JSW10_03625 [Pseudomonadota bacterium]|nr:MAG: hypothetical protein JSW10_03625 [Pseudomonadota bacterium]
MAKSQMKTLSLALGTAFAASLAASNVALADAGQNPFGMSDLSSGYMQLAGKEGKCGEGKCGGEKKSSKEGKCGEGKCGGEKSSKEGKCGGEKKSSKEGKCGEGKCGGKK